MATSVALTLDVAEAANRISRGGNRQAPFEIALSGDGASPWRALFPERPADRPPDVLVLPGLGLLDQPMIDACLKSAPAERARKRIEALHGEGADIAAGCSATFLLASTGLLDGKRATTTWWLAPAFKTMFPKVGLTPDAMVVRDDRLTTAGAAMAQFDLMLALVARFAGSGAAGLCARFMALDGRQSQSAYAMMRLLAAGDERIARAETWARSHLDEGPSVDELAQAAGLSLRTFARRCEKVTGFSPVRFLQRLRLEKAGELMRTTKLSIDEIAHRVGYAEPSTLRRLISKGKRRRAVSAEGLKA